MAAHFCQFLPVDCAKQITMPVRNGFVEEGGEREVRRLPPIFSAVIPIGNIKKANKSPGNSGQNLAQSSLLSLPWLPVRLRAGK